MTMAAAKESVTRSSITRVKPGDIFSRHSFGTVVAVNYDGVLVKNTEGKEWAIGKDIIENEFYFADHVDSTKVTGKLARSKLIDLVMTLPRTAMTVTFTKKPDPTNVANVLSNGQGSMTAAAWKKQVKKAMEGEERTLKGYHSSSLDEHKRLRFIVLGEGAGMKLIDPRTISKLVVHNTVFEVK